MSKFQRLSYKTIKNQLRALKLGTVIELFVANLLDDANLFRFVHVASNLHIICMNRRKSDKIQLILVLFSDIEFKFCPSIWNTNVRDHALLICTDQISML